MNYISRFALWLLNLSGFFVIDRVIYDSGLLGVNTLRELGVEFVTID